MKVYDGDIAWRRLLLDIIEHGTMVNPRGQPTFELLHTNNICININQAVVRSPVRKLNYQFMCAEALWILNGDNQLKPLTRFVKRMKQYSDDGETLAGAYGIQIIPQLNYVMKTLLADRDTRQAMLSIWTPNPKPSKDIPCTVAMVFSIRDNLLHLHVFMRSSDGWLGIPYDMFSFACVGLLVLADYNQKTTSDLIRPGVLTISMTSSHLYEKDLPKVFDLLRSPTPELFSIHIPDGFNLEYWGQFKQALSDQREGIENKLWRVIP